MKFLTVSHDDFSRHCAGREIALEIHKRLPLLGHKSFVIAPHPSRKIDLGVDNLYFFGSPLAIQINQSTNDIDLEDFETHSELVQFLDRESFDIICVHEPVAPFLNWDVIRHSRTANIGWFHATSAYDLNSFPFNLLITPLDEWLKSKLQGLIAVSPSARRTWKKIFGRKGVVLPVGVDVDRFRMAEKIDLGENLNVLFVGRLDKRKGIDHAIRAAAEALRVTDLKLVVVGDGPLRDSVESLVRELRIEGKVDFRGEVSRDELPKYYKSADIYLAPAVGAESLGIVLLEAMAAGTPVVAYANEGYKFTLSGVPWRGSLVRVGSYKEMARSIVKLSKSRELRRRLINWQNQKIKEFDWNRIVSKFVEYAESIRV